jgi:RNA polymerase sigma factor (sigma-70 family)
MAKQPFIATRRSLLTRLKSLENQESWSEFFETYWALLYSVALKSGLSPVDSEEVVQETIISVCRKMPGFSYDPALGSFKGWLLNITRRRIADRFRKIRRNSLRIAECVDPPSGTAAIERFPDPASAAWEATWESEWKQQLLNAAIVRVRASASPRQFQIFDLYVLKSWAVVRVERALGVTAGQVYLAKVRIGKLLEAEVRKLEEGKGVF